MPSVSAAGSEKSQHLPPGRHCPLPGPACIGDPMRKAVLGAALAATALVTSACGQGVLGGGNKKDKGPILLGMDIPLSGSSADIGPYMKNGAQLAIDELNAKGGVL